MIFSDMFSWFILPIYMDLNLKIKKEIVSLFKYGRTISDFAPAKILKTVDGIMNQVRTDGWPAVFENSQAVLSQEFSERNFDIHEKTYHNLAIKLNKKIIRQGFL